MGLGIPDFCRRASDRVVEAKVEKHETRLGTHDTGLAVIETQLEEINKKLDKLLGQQ